MGADVAIFHFGIRYDLFSALAVLPAPGMPVPVVQYHNLTPRELVSEDQRAIIDWSVEQAELIGKASRIWAASRFNLEQLIKSGIDASRVVVLPIPVQAPSYLRIRRGPVRKILYVGRVVPAKGISTLLDAFSLLPDHIRASAELILCGNAGFSDSEFTSSLLARISRGGRLLSRVRLVGEPSDDLLWDLYSQADVFATASFHEGLCLPIIEASLAGSVIVGTSNTNIQYLVPPVRLAQTGDAEGLSRVMCTALEEARSGPAPPLPCVAEHSVEAVRAALVQELADLNLAC
jgi:glycosyltransferase involved in cell wall biosynthesis